MAGKEIGGNNEQQFTTIRGGHMIVSATSEMVHNVEEMMKVGQMWVFQKPDGTYPALVQNIFSALDHGRRNGGVNKKEWVPSDKGIEITGFGIE